MPYGQPDYGREIGDTIKLFMQMGQQEKQAGQQQQYWMQRLQAEEQAKAQRPYTLGAGQVRMGPQGEIARGLTPPPVAPGPQVPGYHQVPGVKAPRYLRKVTPPKPTGPTEADITKKARKDIKEINMLRARASALGKVKKAEADKPEKARRWSTAQEAQLQEAKAKVSLLIKDLENVTIQEKGKKVRKPSSWWHKALGILPPVAAARITFGKKREEYITTPGKKRIIERALFEALKERARRDMSGTTKPGPATAAQPPTTRAAGPTPPAPAQAQPAQVSQQQEAVRILQQAGQPITEGNVAEVIRQLRGETKHWIGPRGR